MKQYLRFIEYTGDEKEINKVLTKGLSDGEHDFGNVKIQILTVPQEVNQSMIEMFKKYDIKEIPES